MITSLSIADLTRNVRRYLRRVGDGERFVLLDDDEPVAELRPLRSGRVLGEMPALIADVPHLSREEADAFADDLEQIRLNNPPPPDPWAS